MKKQKSPFRILIVDDCSDDIARPYVLTSQLGCKVELALDGQQALSAVERDNYDLVILDWNMPVMTGLEFLNCVRASGRGLNVVLYSANHFSHDEISAIDEFRVLEMWKKPMGPIEILKRMKVLRERLERK